MSLGLGPTDTNNVLAGGLSIHCSVQINRDETALIGGINANSDINNNVRNVHQTSYTGVPLSVIRIPGLKSQIPKDFGISTIRGKLRILEHTKGPYRAHLDRYKCICVRFMLWAYTFGLVYPYSDKDTEATGIKKYGFRDPSADAKLYAK